MYADPDSLMNVLYYRTFERLQLIDNQLVSVQISLIGFRGYVIYLEGMITLTMTVENYPRHRTIPVKFAVIKVDSPYNILISRPTLNDF